MPTLEKVSAISLGNPRSLPVQIRKHQWQVQGYKVLRRTCAVSTASNVLDTGHNFWFLQQEVVSHWLPNITQLLLLHVMHEAVTSRLYIYIHVYTYIYIHIYIYLNIYIYMWKKKSNENFKTSVASKNYDRTKTTRESRIF
jgi:hypothetical protein